MKPKFVTIGLIQSKVSSDINANVEKTVKMVRQARKEGAQIVCLQELFQTTYFPILEGVNKDDYAETILGKTTTTMSKLAKELGIVIIVPIYEKAKNGKYYNSAVVYNVDGKSLGIYHKVHIPHDPGFYETEYFEEGNEGYKTFNTPFGKIGVLICFDQWFPEAARACRLAGAEIIFYPTAIANILGYVPPEGDWHNAWETTMRGHAISNGVTVVAVNRTGIEGRSHFWGQSFICDSFGKILKIASATKEQVLIGKVDLNMNMYVSDSWGFLRDRRPDTYGTLTAKKDPKLSKKTKEVLEEEKKRIQKLSA
ncbi:MAG: carbon-nitrogen hydrolase [bacterium]